jgi:glycosyltransferase involved in cell wall biosynthesis
MYCLVSPWPPQRNGIADYCYEIARHTERPLLLFTEAFQPRRCANVEPIDLAQFRHIGRNRRLPFVYHIGNNPDHVFIVPLLLEQPGFAVVHDGSLHYLAEKADDRLPGFFNGCLDAEYGAQAETMRRCWRAPGLKRGIDYREVKMLGWLRDCRGIIVHSRYAARLLAASLPGLPIEVIPHFAYPALGTPEDLRTERRRARTRLEIGDQTTVISTLGFVTRNKQYGAIIQAMRRLATGRERKIVYLVAGELRPHEYDIAAEIRLTGDNRQVRLLGFVAESAMRDVLLASDIVFNLRYPTFGESSGSLSRALGLGCALAVTDAGSYGELPDTVCFKVPARFDPTADIAAILEQVVNDPAALHRRQAAAYEYALTELSPAAASRRYMEFVAP